MIRNPISQCGAEHPYHEGIRAGKQMMKERVLELISSEIAWLAAQSRDKQYSMTERRLAKCFAEMYENLEKNINWMEID